MYQNLYFVQLKIRKEKKGQAMRLEEGAAFAALLVAGSALDNGNPILPAVIVIAALAFLAGRSNGRW